MIYSPLLYGNPLGGMVSLESNLLLSRRIFEPRYFNTAGFFTPAITSTHYVHLREETSSGVSGTFTSGAWQTRVLNTESADTGNVCTLSSNQFTLLAGTYNITARAPAYQVSGHKARLQNITDTATTLIGSSCIAYAPSLGGTDAWVVGRFTIAGTKTFQLQHWCEATYANFGFGYAVGSTGINHVYAEVFLEKTG